ncbi:MAG: fatty acid desaturase family protein [Myxococcota bacterium]
METQTNPPSIFSKSHHYVQISGILLFFALELVLFVRIFSAPSDGAAWATLGLGLALGYVSGDFASGFVHWLFDRYGTVDTPVVGQPFIKPFRIHHVDQKDITLHGFVDTNGNNCLATNPFLIALMFFPTPSGAGLNLLFQAFFAALCVGVFATNQFHKWSHEDNPSPVVRWLQDHHLILGRAHHAIHHAPPYDKYYCIMAGWLNLPLAKLHFWENLEALIFKLTGVQAGVEDAAMVEAARQAHAQPGNV